MPNEISYTHLIQFFHALLKGCVLLPIVSILLLAQFRLASHEGSLLLDELLGSERQRESKDQYQEARPLEGSRSVSIIIFSLRQDIHLYPRD